MELEEYTRLCELKNSTNISTDISNYFHGLEDIIHNSPEASQKYSILEQELQELDVDAWEILKAKAVNYLRKQTILRGWTQLFEALNEAKGYIYLKSIGCSSIDFIPEEEFSTPDLEASGDLKGFLLEVKTINISYDEAVLRKQSEVRDVQYDLDEKWLRKLNDIIEKAISKQLQKYRKEEKLERIVLLVVNFDERNSSVTPILTEKLGSYIQQQSYSCDRVIVRIVE